VTRHHNNNIEIPSLARLTAILLVGVIVYACARTTFAAGEIPLLLPLTTATLSAGALFVIARKRNPMAVFVRIGFHVGMFAYFLSYPILSPESVNPRISVDVHNLLGMILLFTVIGFEAAYWLKVPPRKPKLEAHAQFILKPDRQRLLLIFGALGIVAWFATVWDYAQAAGVSIVDTVLTMRGAVEGAPEDVITSLGYLSYVFGAGVFVAATAALLLLTASKRISNLVAGICWLALLFCASVGFLRGSRAVFLYSFAPLAATCWIKLSKLRTGKSTRWLWIAAAGVLVVIVWGAMSAMRGADIRKYKGGWEGVAPMSHAQGAFDIYSTTAKIVASFPDEIPYEYGKSLVPLVLGWVPRPLWTNKPYPFSLYANIINGETLEARAASLAVGLPGEGYGNFGLLGAFLWGALMGLACRWGDDRIARMNPSNPLRLQLAVTGAIWAAMIVRGGVPEMFYMGLNVIMFPIAIACFMFRSEKSARTRQVMAVNLEGNFRLSK